jgi:UDP-N-acetyl-2-amino-2-deoxyglucuronate dehydrogenase
MLHYVFGDLLDVELHYRDEAKAAGFLRYARANVRWFLSVDASDLPGSVRGTKPTYRSITYDGRELEFSQGFTDLHTVTYQEILAGRGYGVDDAHACVAATEQLRALAPSAEREDRVHPILRDGGLVSK